MVVGKPVLNDQHIYLGSLELVIDLQYLQEKSVEEIRAITGWSAALVKVRAFRARQKLKAQLARLQETHARA